jgi:uncharacterized delta-60 repeat protein
MRDYEMVRRRRVTRGLAIITTALAMLGALFMFVSSAAASQVTARGVHQVGPTLNVWEAGVIDQGVGKVGLDGELAPGVARGVNQSVDLGPVTFQPLKFGLEGRATGLVDTVFGLGSGNPGPAESLIQVEAPTGDPRQPGSQKGGFAFLDQYRDYRKDVSPHKQFVQIKLDQLLLDLIDANGPLTAVECPVVGNPQQRCSSIRSKVKVEVEAYKPGAAHPFFDVGGTIYAEGHEHAWVVGAGTSPVSVRPFWEGAEFDVNGDTDDNTTQSHLVVDNFHPIIITIPLDAVHFQHRFRVLVSLDTDAVDDRGLESAAAARIFDSHGVESADGLARTIARGSTARASLARVSPETKAPPAAPRPAARCPAGPSRHAGQLQLGSQPVTVGEASGSALVQVIRTGGSRGATSAVLSTTGGSARSGTDFAPTRTLVRFENGDRSPRIVEIPIREDRAVESPESFRISLADPHCARLGQRRAATATILDDDQPAPPPPPAFTIGGTVDGLEGSGLVLSNLGAAVPVSANGGFTFPGTAVTGQSYEVNVTTQPTSPDQTCTVDHGTGQVTSTNVTNIAVHCHTPAVPSGLDLTFGTGGRVSTPVGGDGQGEAVVIQPTGRIVTAGWRTVGTGIDTDFALTGTNSDGTPDTSFGIGGIATTDLGGAGDKAHDAALTPDGGIVAVGETDAPGIQKQDFAVVRYLPDGKPDAAFDGDGIVTTDFSGRGDIANAVAVQPDGKIVVAGFATSASGIGSDFALARYNPDGTLDTSFDGGGIVTTDFGALSDDDARALVIQPDGRILVVGTAGEDIALARYTPDGKLDTSFGSGGTKITDLGFDDVATGVALTSDGKIVISGYTIGAKLNNDFLLARYDSHGTLDTTFGTGGIVTTDLGDGDDFAENLIVDAQGRIILVGRATSSTISDLALVRYNPDGTPDTTFDGDGILTADFHGGSDIGQDVALDSQGRIVAAGSTVNGETQFALMRANP